MTASATARPGILGFGGYVPEKIMTNDDWAKLVDTTDDWITTRTGIKRRRFAADDEGTLDLAAFAAEGALKDAGLSADDIDEIVLASDTPELYFPDTAALLQDRLGCRNITTYDLGGSGCAGFVLALDVARARMLLESKRILIVGVELISRMISWKERDTCVLFGDGAGAVVMGPGESRAQLLDVVSGTDGSKAEILTLKTGGTRDPFNAEALASGTHDYLTMDGREVFKEAVRRMSAAVSDILSRIGKAASDVALVIPHQANKRIIDAVRKRLGVDEESVYVNIEEYGNIGSASVPFALWEAQESGHIKEGDLVVLTAFGGGFHWAAAALQF
jgi:3-oxoacyl-[acyl-carrier-protein] synthase-3